MDTYNAALAQQNADTAATASGNAGYANLAGSALGSDSFWNLAGKAGGALWDYFS